jgi:hypothetical protein
MITLPSGLVLLLAMLLLAGWFLLRRRVDVPATIDLEATPLELHAHVVLDGVDVREGDQVTLYNVLAPVSHIAMHEKRTVPARATVSRASLPRRVWERVVGASRVADFFEVGFEG